MGEIDPRKQWDADATCVTPKPYLTMDGKPITWGEGMRSTTPPQSFLTFITCGCMQINLAQGVAVLPCATHQEAVLGVIGA